MSINPTTEYSAINKNTKEWRGKELAQWLQHTLLLAPCQVVHHQKELELQGDLMVLQVPALMCTNLHIIKIKSKIF